LRPPAEPPIGHAERHFFATADAAAFQLHFHATFSPFSPLVDFRPYFASHWLILMPADITLSLLRHYAITPGGAEYGAVAE